MVFASRDFHSQTTTFESGLSDSPRRRIYSELRLVILQLRDPIRGFLPPILIHLYNEIGKLKTHLVQAQLRPWWILEFLRNKVPNFHFCPFLSKRHCLYEFTQVISWGLQLYHLIGDGFHSFSSWKGLLPKDGHDGFWNFYGTRFRISTSAHFYRKGIAYTSSLRSYPEAYNFITWLVMAFIRSLHEKVFCLRTIQLSPSCRSPLPRVIRVWLSPHLKMLPSVPWRGDSLSTGSACSAAHDLSLSKPHLKTSSSTTPSRRSLCLALGPEGLC